MTIPYLLMDDLKLPQSQPLPTYVTTADQVTQPTGSNPTIDVVPPTLSDFVTWVRSAGIQKANRFFADIMFPGALWASSTLSRQDTILACEEVTVPTRSIQTRTLRLGGLDEQRASSLDYGGQFTLTFLVDSTNDIQRVFEQWLNLEVDQTTRQVGEYTDYISTVDLWFMRPFSQNELYDPASRTPNGPDGFLQMAKNRVLNTVAAEIGGQMTKASNKVEAWKQSRLGKQLGTYNRIKGHVPLELLFSEEASQQTDYVMYRISFKEVFPVSITRLNLHQGNNSPYRITVSFAFKEYVTESTPPFKGDQSENKVFNFLKSVGIPTTKSSIAAATINLL